MDETPHPGSLPRTIGRYQVLARLASGAMGETYRARDPVAERDVVVKTFARGLGPEGAGNEVDLERLQRMARVSATLSHPGIVDLLEFGEDGGVAFVVTELVEGETVASLLGKGLRLKPKAALPLIGQAAAAIDHAHRRGVVHGAINPSNLIVYDTDRLKVAGFELATVVEEGVAGPERVLGNLTYLSPEQLRRQAFDGRTDVFSLGVCAFEMLSGERPFVGNTIIEAAYRQVHDPPLEPAHLERSGLVPEAWREVFSRVLAKKAADRYPTAMAFARDLEGCLPECLEPGDETTVVLGAPVGVSAAPAPVKDESERALPVHENVQFTVYRPRAVEPMKWYPLLAFAHLEELPPGAAADEPPPGEQVRAQAERALGDLAGAYGPTRQDSSTAIPHEAEITFVPVIPGFEVNPPRRTFLWMEPVHREDFRIRALPAQQGQVVRGRVGVFWGRIVLADVTVAIRVGAAASPAPPAERTAVRPFRKVFASYSHGDVSVVEEVERYARTLGDVYLRDVNVLRSGERWDDRLRELIREADLFQLFWSWNALESPYVEREWRYALSLERPHFVRPTYWQQPLPERPERDLPPEALRRLHFQLLPGSPFGGAHAPAPASAAPQDAAVSPRRPQDTGAFRAPMPAARPPAAAEPDSSPTMSVSRPASMTAGAAARSRPAPSVARPAPAGRGALLAVAAALLVVVLGAWMLLGIMASRRGTRVAPSPTSPPRDARGAAMPPATSFTPGQLEIHVTSGAVVVVDGVMVGRAPVDAVPLAPGEHVLEVTHPGYAPFRRTIAVRPGVTTAYLVDLVPEGPRR